MKRIEWIVIDKRDSELMKKLIFDTQKQIAKYLDLKIDCVKSYTRYGKCKTNRGKGKTKERWKNIEIIKQKKMLL